MGSGQSPWSQEHQFKSQHRAGCRRNFVAVAVTHTQGSWYSWHQRHCAPSQCHENPFLLAIKSGCNWPKYRLFGSQGEPAWFQFLFQPLGWENLIGEFGVTCPSPSCGDYLEILASLWKVGCASESEAPCDVGKGFVQTPNSHKECQMPTLTGNACPQASSPSWFNSNATSSGKLSLISPSPSFKIPH